MIVSVSNPLVREVCELQTRKKVREETGLFVAEGTHLVGEAPRELLRRVYITEAYAGSPEGSALCARLRGMTETVSETVMAKMSDTRTPQGILAVIRQPGPAVFPGTGGLLVLERVQDPGNVGTLFRTAEAAGFEGILLDEGCADPLIPKTVRSTMGAIFRLPFRVCPDLSAAVRSLSDAGYTVCAAHLAGRSLWETALPRRTAFLLGSEGSGLTEELTQLAGCRVRIPMQGSTESLNVSVAGALLMYEHLRRALTDAPEGGREH